jgi:hypothetical protein
VSPLNKKRCLQPQNKEAKKTKTALIPKSNDFPPFSSLPTQIITLFNGFFGCFRLFTGFPHATRSRKGSSTRKLYESLTALSFSRNMHKKVYMFGA